MLRLDSNQGSGNSARGQGEERPNIATSAVAHVYSGDRLWRTVHVGYDTDEAMLGLKVINPKGNT